MVPAGGESAMSRSSAAAVADTAAEPRESVPRRQPDPMEMKRRMWFFVTRCVESSFFAASQQPGVRGSARQAQRLSTVRGPPCTLHESVQRFRLPQTPGIAPLLYMRKSESRPGI